ncbi:MAG TPA: hypothetical protein VKB35_18490 [Ktedonobacteraceae bacterium]|nr:hypothetical protein [Ktedonobacteraceae bacterium]
MFSYPLIIAGVGIITLLIGPVLDQAARPRLLRKVRDVAMPLLSVMRLQPDPAEASQGI